MKMKKIAAVWMSLCMAAGIAACGNASSTAPTTQGTEAESTQSGEDTRAQSTKAGDEQSTEAGSTQSKEDASTQSMETEDGQNAKADSSRASAEGGKTLVVYFSATGNTKDAAAYIAEATGGDTLELVPVESYSSDDLDWTDENSRVSYEHDNPEARAVSLEQDTVDGWETYDTIFIGYPIWWGIAAWPVDSFIAANDFTGKTVIPFCTSASSGLGDSGKLLAEAAGTGNWLEGIRFSSRVSQEEIQEWLEGLR